MKNPEENSAEASAASRPEDKKLWNALQELRVRLGYSHPEWRDLLCLPQPQYKMICNGKAALKIHHLLTLCMTLNLPLDRVISQGLSDTSISTGPEILEPSRHLFVPHTPAPFAIP